MQTKLDYEERAKAAAAAGQPAPPQPVCQVCRRLAMLVSMHARQCRFMVRYSS